MEIGRDDQKERKEIRLLITAIKNRNVKLSSADARNKIIIREEQAIPPTVALLSSENVKIELAAVRLLRSLSVNEENQQCIADENGIPPLINLLESPFAKLQLNAAATLWNLSVNDENKRKIAKEGAIRPLIFLLDSNNIKVQNEACGALRNLSFNDKNQRLIGKDGGIALLLDLLRSDDENLKRNSAITLNNLTSLNEENKRRLRKEGGTELLINVLLANDINVLGFDPEAELKKRPRPDAMGQAFLKPGLHNSEDSSVSLTTEVFDTIVWHDIKVEKKIGSGAYGDVYKARYHGYPMAVKVIKESLSEDEAKKEKILEELKLMSMLRHPNVVLLVGACLTPDNQVAIVTEYAGRGNLKDCLKDVKSLPQRLKLAKDIVSGLNWLHANNIIHRDLKLANLLVTDDYTIKITDFGLSLHWYEGIVCHHFKGNVKYSSPEILRARSDKSITVYQYCPQTDVYSFGLMLWELVTCPLFPGVKGKQNITQHVLAGNRPEIYDEWPKSLKTLLALCWHDDANRRPLFREIQDKFDRVIIDVMCADPTGRRICKKLWKGCELRKVPYEEFEEAFLEKTRLNLKLIRHIHLKCLCAIICDPFDDTITLERFCNAVAWHGPLFPVEKFLERIRSLLEKEWFHGFQNSQKSSQLLKTRWTSTKQTYFLYRYSLSTPGCFALTFIEEDGTIVHKRISHSYNSTFALINNSPPLDFATLEQLHAACKSSAELLRNKKFLPGSPFAPLFQ